MEDREFAIQVAEILEGNCRLSAAEIAAMLEADEERVSAAIEAMEQERMKHVGPRAQQFKARKAAASGTSPDAR